MTSKQAQALAERATEIAALAPAPEWDSVPELKKWKDTIQIKANQSEVMKFDRLVVRERELAAEIKFREAILKQVRSSLHTSLLLAEQDRVECEGYEVKVITRKGSTKIVPEKLLSAGISAKLIAECSETGDDSSFVKVDKAKDR